MEAGTRWVLPDLAGAVPGAAIEPQRPSELAVGWFDTADLRLLRRGVTLEHRDGGTVPGSWVLHLPGTPAADVTWEGGRDAVPDEVVRLLHGVTGDRALEEVAHVVTTRHRLHVATPEGHVVATVDDDVVDLSRGQWRPGRERHLSVRVAGRAGEAAARSITRHLRRSGARAAGPAADPLAGLLRSRPPAVAHRAGPASPMIEAVAAVIAAGVDRLVASDPRLRLDGDPDAIHDARVATRRLRSDLKTYGDVLDPVWVEQTRNQLRWLGERLGAVRDADVLRERLGRRSEQLSPSMRAGLGDLLAASRLQRDAAYAELLVALESPRYRELLDELERAAGAPPRRDQPSRQAGPVLAALPRRARRPPRTGPDHRAGRAVPRLVGRPWRRLDSRVRAAGAVPSDHELHQVRIGAKELRYAAEAAAPVVGAPAARLAKRAKRLQEVLGDHHDAVVTEAWLERNGVEAGARGAFTAGVLVGVERDEQRALRLTWRREWKTLRATSHGWLR